MMAEDKLFGVTVHRECGNLLRRYEQFEKAKVAYDEALKTNPDDVRTLIGRSQVCVDSLQPLQAYVDAELALKLEPRNMTARNMQARALFSMSDFERSVVMNSRGLRYRRQPPYFKEGVIQGMEVLQDCIGKNAGSIMTDMLPHINKFDTAILEEEEETLQEIKHISRIPKQEQKSELTPAETRKHAILNRVLAMEYLGPMAYDKFFLQELINDPRLKSANAAGSKKLEEIIKETLKALSDRQEMLRRQRPYYNIKRTEKTVSKHQKKFNDQMLIRERATGAKNTEKQLKLIEKYLREHRIMDLMKQAARLQCFLDMKTPRTLPDKERYTDRLYRAVGEGYLSQHRLSFNLSDRSNNRRIAFLMGLRVPRPTSYDSVYANYPFKFEDAKMATEKALTTLEKCENSTMRCWLMYELSRLLATQKNFALSKFYAKRCQRQAQEIQSVTWWLNGCFLLMSGDMQQGNTSEVRELVREAYEWTKQLPNPESMQAFLSKCLELTYEKFSDDDGEDKKLVQREKQITQVMEGYQKVESQNLFRRISKVPAGRRFSVAKVKTENTLESKPVRKKERERGLSIVHGPDKAMTSPTVVNASPVAGLQEFDV